MPMLILRPLELADADAALAAQRELDADDFDFLLGYSSKRGFGEFLEQLNAHEQGIGLPEGWVRSALLGAFVDGTLVGRTSIRYELTSDLLHVGGHIGYAVRPEFRRRGYAGQILHRSLDVLAARGTEYALVTCAEENLASAKTITRCGGVLDDIVQVGQERTRRYWVSTASGQRL
ncbi:GNAT family N-acetyltransferase [Arthrobacter sp. MYb227]|uniref:GNAT family N-acetyltransferase n=1 Tax=Arthrobacter sp. MYb227 TaxID=1848601 RepID=UPI0021581A99|nr:GNAT family N-acetyltransferase [Arthrobacter sp. MYb227]